MSCRDARAWSALLAHRFAEGAEPAEWPEARAHLESCAACRRIALGVDPTLAFLRLSEPVPAPASEIEAMRQAVAGLRRASARGVIAPQQQRFRLPAVGRLGRFAAAAAFVLAVGSQLPSTRHAAVAPAAASPASAVADLAPVAGEATTPDASLGVAGDVGRPSARVYQIAYHDMAVVMVVDKSLDL